MGASVNETTETAFEPLLQFDMEMEIFLSDWQHCDHVSSYLARMISHNRTDPVRHSNFFSSALNELLEVSFRGGTTDGKIGLSIYRQGGTERVQLSFPCPPGQARFYREAVSKTRESDAQARYLDAISNDLAPSRESVLLDLAEGGVAEDPADSLDGHPFALVLQVLGRFRNVVESDFLGLHGRLRWGKSCHL